MKIIEGLKLDGAPAEIPDCGRNDLPQFFIDMGYKVGAEIGTYRGSFAEKICRAGLKLYCVDPWEYFSDYTRKDKEEFQKEINEYYEQAKKVLAPYSATIIKKTSMEALIDIPDESLDFVYIDGNHSFKFVVEDIYEWSKKVKKGGVISGHDYVHMKLSYEDLHVKYVLPAYTKAYNIYPWYVLGRNHANDGEIRDKVRSWFWIKK
jgi:hypothetical protein